MVGWKFNPLGDLIPHRFTIPAQLEKDPPPTEKPDYSNQLDFNGAEYG